MIAATAPPPTTSRVRWTLLLLASAAVHAAILSGWRPAVLPALGGDRTTPLTVTMVSLSGPRQATAARPAKAVPRQPQQRRSAIVKAHAPARPIARRKATPKRQPQPSRRTQPAAAPGSGATHQAAALKQQVVGRIRGLLARYFTYPPRARREGWQGVVLLRFRINSDGTIAAMGVAHSSGHALLDRAALGALGKVGRLSLDTTLPAPLELQMPVIYRLEAS